MGGSENGYRSAENRVETPVRWIRDNVGGPAKSYQHHFRRGEGAVAPAPVAPYANDGDAEGEAEHQRFDRGERRISGSRISGSDCSAATAPHAGATR